MLVERGRKWCLIYSPKTLRSDGRQDGCKIPSTVRGIYALAHVFRRVFTGLLLHGFVLCGIGENLVFGLEERARSLEMSGSRDAEIEKQLFQSLIIDQCLP